MLRNKLVIATAFVAIVSLALAAAVSADAEEIKVTVCHATASASNPYVKVVVSVHSVDDANGLNGHGDHQDDAWHGYTFDSVDYPGRNTGLFGSTIDEDCNLIQQPTETPVPPTATLEGPTATPETPVATNTPGGPTNTPRPPHKTPPPETPTGAGDSFPIVPSLALLAGIAAAVFSAATRRRQHG